MSEIKVVRNPSAQQLQDAGVFDWPIWEKEASRFPWEYADRETCYFLEGEVSVTPEGGEPMQMGKGDMVIFPAGMACHWDIRQAVRKHYQFG